MFIPGDGYCCSYAELESSALLLQNVRSEHQLAAHSPTPSASEGVVVNSTPNSQLFRGPATRLRFQVTQNGSQIAMTADQINRAQRAILVHQSMYMNCPDDHRLGLLLDSGRLNLDLTSRDLANGRALYGPCPYCAHANIVRGPQRPSNNRHSNPPPYPGHSVAVDIIPFASKIISGDYYCFVSSDVVTGYMLLARLRR